jgi:hypothetical protein
MHTDDRASSSLQVAEIKAFVQRHSSFMEVALSAADVGRIVQANKMAVVLGVEIDNIGDFSVRSPPSQAQVTAEIQALFDQGVRYIFPIHVADNVFGGTATYEPMFNAANVRETGSPWQLECSDGHDDITIKFDGYFSPNSAANWLLNALHLSGVPSFPPCSGHRNHKGLSSLGAFAIKEMMRRGMIIDIDHMSQNTVEQALPIFESVGYPVVSGHSAIRGVANFNAESHRSRSQLQRIGCLGGMFGIGTDGVEAWTWAGYYADAFNEMAKRCPGVPIAPGSVALGTDTNSLVGSPRSPFLSAGRQAPIYAIDPSHFPTSPSSTLGRTWDYNVTGVAHYGMYADFVKDIRFAPTNHGMTGADLVDNHLMRSADAFWHMWQKIEAQKSKVP